MQEGKLVVVSIDEKPNRTIDARQQQQPVHE